MAECRDCHQSLTWVRPEAMTAADVQRHREGGNCLFGSYLCPVTVGVMKPGYWQAADGTRWCGPRDRGPIEHRPTYAHFTYGKTT